MKTKFKYLTLLASAFLIGFSSCSNDDETGTGGNGHVEGQKTIAKINLTQVSRPSTYAATGTEAPSEAEKIVKSAVLYVFNSSKVLESTVSLYVIGTRAEKVFELTTGDKHFYAAVNIPEEMKPSFETGTPMNDVIKSILTVTHVTDLYPATSGFFMTNVDTPTEVYIVKADQSDVDGTTDTKNNITIPVGRAMIKASLKYDKANVIQPNNGELDNVKFLLANNPVQMYYMAYVNNAGQLETPYFNNDNAITGNYYPNLATTPSGFIAADGNATTYGMENSNKVVRTGNATYALIQGKFTPKKVVDKDGDNETDGIVGADFWRIQLADGDFINKFYKEDPTNGSDMTANAGIAAVKYTNGLCYYAFYLADNSVSGNSTVKYTVKRNSFWKMMITHVSGVGSNTPGGVVPDPMSPIEANTFIKGQIDILDWAVYEQSGGI